MRLAPMGPAAPISPVLEAPATQGQAQHLSVNGLDISRLAVCLPASLLRWPPALEDSSWPGM